jgi:hypothetical protein
MSNYVISINQLAEFTTATEKGKMRIIRQQKVPDPFLIQWYRIPKSRIKKFFAFKGDFRPILEGLEILKKKVPKNNQQITDKLVSIEALERFLKIKLPGVLFEMDYKMINPKVKSVEICGVDLKVSPDIIVRGELNGETVIGGIKLHICKGKPFDYKKSLYVATSIYKYLAEKIAQPGEVVHPGLCFSLDIFGDRPVPAPDDPKIIILEIENYCEEIKKLWEAA